ncbi:MAG TPA: hypothetical protein VG942_00220 [Hyphomonadaceae bacterium]|nr:hypothetical protein [Hyphomonadaceae bacterium]
MRVLIACLALLAAPAFAQAAPYDAPGPYTVKQTQGGPGCHVFRPIKPMPSPSPVILWGNGTNSMVAIYSRMLSQWSSYGFIVAASMSGNVGSGRELIACLDFLEKENTRDGSPLKGAVDTGHVGASGHSQGGGGAIMAGRDPRITTTAPIEPYIIGANFYEPGAERKQHGPMLLLSGGVDTIAVPDRHHKPVFEQANVPVVWATLLSAGHNSPAVGDSGPFRPITTAWFLYQLAGDQKAAAMFQGASCGYCNDPLWAIQKRNAD